MTEEVRSGAGADVESAAGNGHRSPPFRAGDNKGKVEILGEGDRQIGGDGREVFGDPLGVFQIVVIGDFHQVGGGLGAGYFIESGGGNGAHQGGLGVDQPQIAGEDLGGPPSFLAGGVIENQ